MNSFKNVIHIVKCILGILVAIQPADYVKKKILVAFVLTLFCRLASLKIISHFVFNLHHLSINKTKFFAHVEHFICVCVYMCFLLSYSFF